MELFSSFLVTPVHRGNKGAFHCAKSGRGQRLPGTQSSCRDSQGRRERRETRKSLRRHRKKGSKVPRKLLPKYTGLCWRILPLLSFCAFIRRTHPFTSRGQTRTSVNHLETERRTHPFTSRGRTRTSVNHLETERRSASPKQDSHVVPDAPPSPVHLWVSRTASPRHSLKTHPPPRRGHVPNPVLISMHDTFKFSAKEKSRRFKATRWSKGNRIGGQE